MATHTESGTGAQWRKFAISRENGQVDKNGRPYFFEWISGLPANTEKRKFETRTKGEKTTHYELFAAMDGYLIDVREEMKDLGNGMESWLVLHLNDLDGEYVIEVGRIDSRYSIDIMKRLLNPNFSPNQKIRLAPYAIAKEGGGWNIGVSAYSGVDKLEHSQTSDFLRGIAQPLKSEWKGDTLWDYSPVGKWLFDKVQELIAPKLLKDPISVPQPKSTQQPANTGDEHFPTTPPPVDHENATSDGDDLPF